MKHFKSNLIGFGLAILGGVLIGITGIFQFSIILFVGIFLFVSFPDEAVFYDYRIAHSDEVLIRRRYYMDFIPFTLISSILTLGKATLRIVWKEEYYRAAITAEETVLPVRISRKEYIALRNEQRIIYSTQVLSREFMQSSYTEADIGFKRKKKRLIAVSILAGIMLTLMTEPDGIYLTLIYEAVFVPMIILWIPEYKDAKILHQAYTKSLSENNPKTAQ